MRLNRQLVNLLEAWQRANTRIWEQIETELTKKFGDDLILGECLLPFGSETFVFPSAI
jgi:hypothetical protein